jgi:anti-anti-sigma regulatory factor
LKGQTNNNHRVIILGKTLKMDSIEEQLQVLTDALNSKNTIIIEANEVLEVDSASLQLLLSFLLEVDQRKIDYQWKSPSTYLIKMVSALGMKKVFNFSRLVGSDYAH